MQENSIYLEPSWAKFYDYKTNQGSFIGREKEVLHLKNTILNSDSGSILVSGVRGSGKTTFVYKVINELIKESPKNLVPIIINAAHIWAEAPKDQTIDKNITYKLLIENLIRRMYATIKDEKLPPELETLYKKVQGNYLKYQETSQQNSQEYIDEIKKELNLSIIISDYFYFIVLPVIGGILNLATNNIWLKAIGSFFLSMPIIRIGYKYGSISSNIMSRLSKRSSKEIYQIDSNVSNLEFDLNELLDKYSSKNKYVFVIDELDKLGGNACFDLIRLYKNLFMLSKANFIFIADQQAYEKIISSDKITKVEPTLFSHIYYLNFPEPKELIDYLSNITRGWMIDGKKQNHLKRDVIADINIKIIDFYYYLIFKAKSDIFNLKNLIHDLSFYKSKDEQYISITDSMAEEINDSDYDVKVSLQKIIGQMYSLKQSNMKSKWKNNYDILMKMHAFFDKYYNINFEDEDIEGSELLIDLVDYLVRLKILEQATSKTSTAKSSYGWTGTTNEIPETPDILFKKEKELKEAFESYISVVNTIDDFKDAYKSRTFKSYNAIYSERDASDITGIKAYAVFSKYEDYYDKLFATPPKHIPEDKIDQIINDLKNELNKFYNNSFKILCALTKETLNKEGMELPNQSTVQAKPQLVASIQSLRNIIAPLGHQVFYNDELSKQIIVVQNMDPSTILTNNDLLSGLFEQSSTYLLVNILTGEAQVPEKIKFKNKRVVRQDNDGKDIIKEEEKSLKNILFFRFNNDFKGFSPCVLEIKKWLEKKPK
jgi:Cdc6-like AAA superfamily ATPase